MNHGHLWTDILEYTMEQFTTFAKAAAEADGIRQAQSIAANAIGAHGDGKAIKKAISELTDGSG